MNIDAILQKKDVIKSKLHDLSKQIFLLENELVDIDKQLSSFSDDIILENMNQSKQQQLIVDAKEDNILVVACPGSGKTHTLICRYVKLILNNDYQPDEILLITFTKKAGMEMLNRLSKILPHKLPYHVGSLHGLSYKVLQEYNDINYTVLDEKDTKDYIKDIIDNHSSLKQFNQDDISMLKFKILTIIDQASTIYPFDMKSVIKKHNLDKYSKEINLIYKLYQQKKKKENLIDFNDLMIRFSKFLDEDKSCLFKNKIKYIFFDEYQDVNPIQNYILSKLSENSKLMVVGDDAQSIYSFRGSSVKYILNFNENFNNKDKTNKMYLLSENYRSTPNIVNFCQDIINNNTNQFKKDVISKQDKVGVKPCVLSFKSPKEQYQWIIDDIIKKNEQGIPFSDMVILARKNNLLDEIELHLMGKKIPTAKHLGLSLLDKAHVKDFMAFIIIMLNPKSSIHWKRIISIHPGFGIKKANLILDNTNDILTAIKTNNQLIELYDNFINLKKIKKDIDKARFIMNYLEKLWIAKKESNIDGKLSDIYNLLNYLKNSSLEDFINDLYLNQEVETNLENIIYLTTIHGAKGLEWSVCYIIDMDSKNFPSIRTKYYLEELEDVDEERRLFYVAASRAKKYLYITYFEDLNPDSQIHISPLLREINPELYTGCGVKIDKFQPTLIISKDVQNYLRFIGYNKISNQLNNLVNNRSSINKSFDIPKEIENLQYKTIIGNFLDFLISKMIQINYPNKIKKFDLNIIHKDNKFPQKIYLDYIDPQTDWRNILEHIFYISVYKFNNQDFTEYKNFLISPNSFNYYLELEKGICKLINNLKPKEIYTHYTVSFGNVKGEIDILCNDTIVEVKSSSSYEIATVPNICQVLLYAYLLKKKEHQINNIILYNPINGELNEINITDFNLVKFKKSIYND